MTHTDSDLKSAQIYEGDFSRSRRLSSLLKLFFKDYAFSVPVFGALACAAFSAIVLMTDFSGSDESAAFSIGTGALRALFGVNCIFILLLIAVIGRKLYNLRSGVKAHRQSRFGYRLAMLLSIASVAPALLIAVFSAVTIKISMESWFNKRVERAIYNADAVADAYLAEHTRNIRADILAAAADIRIALIGGDLPDLMAALKFQALTRDLRYIGVFSEKGERLLYFSAPGEEISLSLRDMARIRQKKNAKSTAYFQPDIALKADKTGVTALAPILPIGNKNEVHYLYITRDVNPAAVRNREGAAGAVRGYELLKLKKHYAEVGFTLIYLSFCLSVTAFMIYAGVYFAHGASAPIEALTRAADRLRFGDPNPLLPEPKKIRDEIDRLISAFNGMSNELRQRERDLLFAREISEDRGKLNEAVLFGVSSGVIALGGEGEIRSFNRVAQNLLENNQQETNKNHNLREICGAFFEAFLSLRERLPLINGLSSDERNFHFAECDVMRSRAGGAGEGKFQVRLTRCGKDHRDVDYVMTFDDVTELVKAQSAAAWRDIARRIAHEIKNPLTPISLAAERMRRKWGPQITEGKADFEECADAIIRQTENIRAMTDSFSKLAKSPNVHFAPEKLREIIREAVFLEQIRNPQFRFTIKDGADAEKIQVLADKRALSQAFTNLLKNAAESLGRRAAREKAGYQGKVEIEIGTEQDRSIVRITDNGEGLPENIAPYLLFQPYVTGSETGTGIGLAVAESAFQEHKGGVSVTSRLDAEKGAVVSVFLPLLVT